MNIKHDILHKLLLAFLMLCTTICVHAQNNIAEGTSGTCHWYIISNEEVDGKTAFFSKFVGSKMPEAGTGWLIYDNNIQLEPGTGRNGTTGILERNFHENMQSAVFFRECGDNADAAHRIEYGNGNGVENGLKLSGGIYQMVYYAGTWNDANGNANGTSKVFVDIINASTKNVVFHSEHVNVANFENGGAANGQADKVEETFSCPEGNYIIKAWGTNNTVWGSLSIDANGGKLVVEPVDGVSGTLDSWNYYSDISGYDGAPWYAYHEQILSAEIKDGVIATTCTGFFQDCKNMAEVNLSGLNTENVTDMSWMFNSCSSLTTLDLSNFNTEDVTYMNGMFFGCSSLTTLDVSNFNTEIVTSMYGMFYDCSSLTTLDLSKFNTENVTDMSFMFSGCSRLTTLDVSNFNTENVTRMYCMFNSCSSLTTLDLSKFNTGNVTSMYGMFNGCSSLTALDVSKFDTGNVTQMDGMFYGCSSLTTLDISHFNTGNVTSMSYMFYGCSALTSLDVSKLNTQHVTAMNYMFAGCTNLESLNLTNLSTIYIDVDLLEETRTDISYMFDGCNKLTTIISNATTPSSLMVGTFAESFGNRENCTLLVPKGTKEAYAAADGWNELGKIKEFRIWDFSKGVSDESRTNLDADNAAWMKTMLDDVTLNWDSDVSIKGEATANGNVVKELAGLYFSDFAASNALRFYPNKIRLQKNCAITIKDVAAGEKVIIVANSANTTATDRGFALDNAKDLNGKSSFIILGRDVKGAPEGGIATIEATVTSDGDLKIYTGLNGAPSSGIEIISIYVEENQNETIAEGISGGCRWYITKEGKLVVEPTIQDGVSKPLGSWNNAAGAPWHPYCEQILSAEIKWGVMAETCTAFFKDCKNMTSIDLSGLIILDFVTDMSYMFAGCSSLQNIDFSKLDFFETNKTTDMSHMFDGCSSLTTLDVSNFNTGNVTNMSNMFASCFALTSLDLKTFNTQKVKNMYSMFYGCGALEKLDLSSFDTQNVTDMGLMLGGLSALTTLDIRHFDTRNVTNMNAMFSYDFALESLDVSNFDTQNATNMSYMFRNCWTLKELTVSNFNTQNVTNMDGMFTGCRSLTSLDASNLDAGKCESIYRMFSNMEEAKSISTPQNMKPVSTSTNPNLSGNNSLLELKWNSTAPISQQELANLNISGNFILFVPQGYQGEDVGNTVRNGYIQELVLKNDMPMYTTQDFMAGKVSYTKEFTKQTYLEQSAGWETLMLPFDVQKVTSETRGEITPFHKGEGDKHFWLCGLTEQGFGKASHIKANIPYIIAMPNSDVYIDEYNITGNVTFSAENAIVMPTANTASYKGKRYDIYGTYEAKEGNIFTLNMQSTYDYTTGKDYYPGGAFVDNAGWVRPFEAYVIPHDGNGAKRVLPVFDDDDDDATNMFRVYGVKVQKMPDLIYDIMGRRLTTPRKGLNIINGRKVLKK